MLYGWGRRAGLAAGLAAGLIALAAPGEAIAQTRDPAAAEALFRAGLEALDRGDWGVACGKFAASQELDASAGTSINVARCAEHDGRLAAAWAELMRARQLAREAPERRRRELETFVDSEIRRIEARLPRLRVTAADLPPGAEIRRDGLPIALGALGEPLPVDVGTHEIAATAPGYLPGSWRVEAAEGKTTEVVVRLVLAPAAGAAPPVGAEPATEPSVRPGPRSRTLPVLGLMIGGVGVAGLAVAAVTGASAIDAKGDIEELGCSHEASTCPTPAAATRAAELGDRGGDLATVSTVSFIAGGVLLATGATLVIVDALNKPGRTEATVPRPKRAGSKGTARVVPVLGPGGGGLWLTGGF